MSPWKRDFASGLIVLLPLLVIAYVINWVYQRVAALPFVPELTWLRNMLAPLGLAPAARPFGVMMTVLALALFVLAVGYLMRTTIGNLVESGVDTAVNGIPGLRVVYNASKMAVETAVGGTDELQAPVKLETWNGLRMTAFKTGKTTEDGREVLFLPTSPNITTGFVIEVDPDAYVETDETVEDALTRVLSAGFGETNDQQLPVDVDGDRPGSPGGVAGDDRDPSDAPASTDPDPTASATGSGAESGSEPGSPRSND